MKQSESNLFSGGMNLDANPIAIDNKSLHSALNATMITMNGNELILQNDMGNAEVGTAKLPDGYVPIGMKEFGGIVYVAAYNPLKRTSLIGSFPSPLQQNDQESDGAAAQIGGFTSTINNEASVFNKENVIDKYALSVKVSSDKLRPGDRFYIVLTKQLLAAIQSGCYTYDICILDSSNSLVPITDKLVLEDDAKDNSEFPGLYIMASKDSEDSEDSKETLWYYNGEDVIEKEDQDKPYYYYKGNLVGYVYFKLSLNIPEFFQYSIIGRETEGSTTNKKYIDITLPKHDFITKYKIVCTPSKGNVYTSKVTMPKLEEVEEEESTDVTTSISVTNDWPQTYEETDEEADEEHSSDTITLDNIVTIKITPYFEETASTENEKVVNGYLDKLTYTCTVNLNKLGSGQIDFSEFRYYTNVNEGTVLLNYSLMSYLNSTQIINSLELVATPWKNITTESTTIGAKNQDGVTVTLSDGSYNLSGSFLKTIEDLEMNTIYVAVLKCTIGTVGDDSSSITKYGKPFVLITSELVNGMYTSNDTEYIDGAETIYIPQTITATYGDRVTINYELGSTSDVVSAETTGLDEGTVIANRATYTIDTKAPSYKSTLNVTGTAFNGLFKTATVWPSDGNSTTPTINNVLDNTVDCVISGTPTMNPLDTRSDYANSNNGETSQSNGATSETTYTAYSEFVSAAKLSDALAYNLYGHLPYLGDATCEDVLLAELIPVADGTTMVDNANAVSRWYTHEEWNSSHAETEYRMCAAVSVDRTVDNYWVDLDVITLTDAVEDWKFILPYINEYFENNNLERPLILFIQWYHNSNRILFPPEKNPTLYRKNFSIPMLMASNGKYYALNEYGFAYQPTDASFAESEYTYPSHQSEIDSLRELLNNVFVYQSTKPQIYACKIVTADKNSYYYDGDYTVTITHATNIAEAELSYDVGKVHTTSINFNADTGEVYYIEEDNSTEVDSDTETADNTDEDSSTSTTSSNIKILNLPKCKTAKITNLASSLTVNISGLESFALLALSADGNPSLGNGLLDGETWHFDKYYNPGEIYFKIYTDTSTYDYYTTDQVVNMFKVLGAWDPSNIAYYNPSYATAATILNSRGIEEQKLLNKKLFFLACLFKNGLLEYKASSEYNSIGGIYLGSKYAVNFAAQGGHIFRNNNTLASRGMLLKYGLDCLNTNRLTDITAADSNYNG